MGMGDNGKVSGNIGGIFSIPRVLKSGKQMTVVDYWFYLPVLRCSVAFYMAWDFFGVSFIFYVLSFMSFVVSFRGLARFPITYALPRLWFIFCSAYCVASFLTFAWDVFLLGWPICLYTY